MENLKTMIHNFVDAINELDMSTRPPKSWLEKEIKKILKQQHIKDMDFQVEKLDSEDNFGDYTMYIIYIFAMKIIGYSDKPFKIELEEKENE